MSISKAPKRVLVTGATGYIGSHLVRSLVKESCDVHVILRPESLLDQLENIKENITLHFYDGSTDSIFKIIALAHPLIVYHLASHVTSTHEHNDISSLINSNILFGTQLLEALTIHEIPFFVNTGTYWQHYNNQTYSPVSLYAATKKAFEDIIQFYTETTRLKAITLKLFDIYGPNDPRQKLFPQLIRAVNSGKSLSMTCGEQKLDLVYIDDAVEAFLTAGEIINRHKDSTHQLYFISSEDLFSLREIVALFKKQIKKDLSIKWGGKPYNSRQIMIPRIPGKKLPGWKAKIGLKEGIQRVIKGLQ